MIVVSQTQISICSVLWAELVSFCMKHFYFKEQLTSYSDLVILQTFSWKWMKEVCHIKKNNYQHLMLVIKFELFFQKLEFWKTYIYHGEFNKACQFLDFLIRSVVIWTNVIIFFFCIMCEHLEDFINQWTSIFCMMLQNCIKNPFKVQDRWMDFNVNRVFKVHWYSFIFYIATKFC